jgi:arginyl-tRNA synthetase
VFFSERSLIETGNNKVAETIDFCAPRAMSMKAAAAAEGQAGRGLGGPRADAVPRHRVRRRRRPAADQVGRLSYTYFASDIAYHKNKFDRGFHE